MNDENKTIRMRDTAWSFLDFKRKIAIENHWHHWQSHIIIFGIQTVQITDMREKPVTDCLGLEVTLFGFGFQLFNFKIINWLLIKVWEVPEDSLGRQRKYYE